MTCFEQQVIDFTKEKRRLWEGAWQPVTPLENPVYLTVPGVIHGAVEIQVMKWYEDNYRTEPKWLNKAYINNRTCQICLEPIQKDQWILHTCCDCELPIHKKCFNDIGDYGVKVVANQSDSNEGFYNVKVPAFVVTCGFCRGPYMGEFQEQFDCTTVAYRHFFAIDPRTPEIEEAFPWKKCLPPIILSNTLLASFCRCWAVAHIYQKKLKKI